MKAHEFLKQCKIKSECLDLFIKGMPQKEIIETRANLKAKIANQDKWNLILFESTFCMSIFSMIISITERDNISSKLFIKIDGDYIISVCLFLFVFCVLASSLMLYKKAQYVRVLSYLEDYDSMKYQTEHSQGDNFCHKKTFKRYIEQYKKELTAGVVIGVVLLVGVPLVLDWLFSLFEIDSPNDWIGFWGGYLGSIFGGCITLFVLFYTVDDNRKNLKKTMDFEKEKILLERKTMFNDELLEQLIKFHSDLQDYCTYFLDLADGKIMKDCDVKFKQDDRIKELTALSNLIGIKVISKKNNKEYKNIDKLLGCIIDITKKLKEISGDIKGKEPEEAFNIAVQGLRVLKEKANSLFDAIEFYYVENEK